MQTDTCGGTNTTHLNPRKTTGRILGRIFGSTVILCLSSSSTNPLIATSGWRVEQAFWGSLEPFCEQP